MRRILSIFDSIWLCVIQDMPGAIGFNLRYRYWKQRLRYLGKPARIDCGVYFQGPESISVGENCWIDRSVIMLAGRDPSSRKRKELPVRSLGGPGEINIGNNVHIGALSIISGIEGGVYIGKDCTFSAGVKVYALSHHFRFEDDPENRLCSFGSLVGEERQSMISGAITFEENIGVALNAIILPGVWIGRDSFVEIGSVVKTGAYEENSILGGSPAIRKRPRFGARSSRPV